MDRGMLDMLELNARRIANAADALTTQTNLCRYLGRISPEARSSMRELLARLRRLVDNAAIQLEDRE